MGDGIGFGVMVCIVFFGFFFYIDNCIVVFVYGGDYLCNVIYMLNNGVCEVEVVVIVLGVCYDEKVGKVLVVDV